MRAWLFALLLVPAVVRAEETEPFARTFARDFTAYAARIVDAAESSRNPRVLLAAASYAVESPHVAPDPALAARREALIERAVALGADDPVVWWMLAAGWRGLPPERHAQAVRRLRQLAPNNAMAWLLVADAHDDVDANFARAARSNRFDLYEGEYVRALHAAAGTVPVPPMAFALLEDGDQAGREARARLELAVGLWSAQGRPSLGAYNERCVPFGEPAGATLQDCLALARLLANRTRSPTLQRVGASLLARRLPPGEERSAAEAARRRLDWMQEQSMALGAGESAGEAARRWLDADGDELAVLRTLLERHGVPLEPPAGWRSGAQPVAPPPLPPAD